MNISIKEMSGESQQDLSNIFPDQEGENTSRIMPSPSFKNFSIEEGKRYQGLVQKIGEGNESAFKELYDSTVYRVFGLSFRIVNDRELAEEITEDVYIKVWKHANSYDPSRAPVMVWLQTICRSKSIDALRNREKADCYPDPSTLLNDEQISVESSQDLLLAFEQNGKLHKAMETLSAVQRQLLALAFFQGNTHEEIAAHSMIPLGTVKSHIRSALKILRTRLAHYQYSISSEIKL